MCSCSRCPFCLAGLSRCCCCCASPLGCELSSCSIGLTGMVCCLLLLQDREAAQGIARLVLGELQGGETVSPLCCP